MGFLKLSHENYYQIIREQENINNFYMNKILISLFDLTGNASRPYLENGWNVKQIDIQLGDDILTWDYRKWYLSQVEYEIYPEVGIIAMIPCDNYATSGAKHFKVKDQDGRTEQSQILVKRVKEIIDFFETLGVLKFWQVENPRTRIHTLNPWLKPIIQKFNPCDFAIYDPIPENSNYNKETWLFGKFNPMIKKSLIPKEKDNPGWKKYGGKSLKTKNARSITPLGFAYAFYDANH